MNLTHRILSAIWEVATTDRTIHVGVASSGASLWGADKLQNAQQYLAAFAALFGGLSAAAVFVYTVIKIVLLLKNQSAKDID